MVGGPSVETIRFPLSAQILKHYDLVVEHKVRFVILSHWGNKKETYIREEIEPYTMITGKSATKPRWPITTLFFKKHHEATSHINNVRNFSPTLVCKLDTMCKYIRSWSTLCLICDSICYCWHRIGNVFAPDLKI